jgi:hypothetical protein
MTMLIVGMVAGFLAGVLVMYMLALFKVNRGRWPYIRNDSSHKPDCVVNIGANGSTIDNRPMKSRRHHERGMPATRADHHHPHERIRFSRLRMLLQRRAVRNAAGRLHKGSDATRKRPAAEARTTEDETRMTGAAASINAALSQRATARD